MTVGGRPRRVPSVFLLVVVLGMYGCASVAPSTRVASDARGTADSPAAATGTASVRSPGPSASRGSAATTASTASNAPSAVASAGVPAGPVSNVLTVTCTATGTDADAERAALQPDGLHVHIRNTSGTERAFDVEDIGGDNAPSVEGLQVWPVPVGTARFSCGPEGSEPVAVEIVDPAGYFVSDVLDCAASTSTVDYAARTEGPKGDVLIVARNQISGLRPGDRVERAGFARSTEPRVRVVRDGKPIAVVAYTSDGGGGWLRGMTSVCDGAEITLRE